jgi:hypothetical protein
VGLAPDAGRARAAHALTSGLQEGFAVLYPVLELSAP